MAELFSLIGAIPICKNDPVEAIPSLDPRFLPFRTRAGVPPRRWHVSQGAASSEPAHFLDELCGSGVGRKTDGSRAAAAKTNFICKGASGRARLRVTDDLVCYRQPARAGQMVRKAMSEKTPEANPFRKKRQHPQGVYFLSH
ncbi:MAG: hypothetical protein WA740_06200 [Candidatus Binataceae bacterium]